MYVGPSPLPVVVYTDHNPLIFLARMYNQNQRLMRWALIVQDYNSEIRHKKGSENVLANALPNPICDFSQNFQFSAPVASLFPTEPGCNTR